MNHLTVFSTSNGTEVFTVDGEREGMTDHEDVLINIFSLLPSKSLVRFKSLARTWLSHISSPYFVQLHGRRNSDPRGILVWSWRSANHFNFFPLGSPIPPLTCFDFIPDPSGVKILQSRKGLLLCSSPSNHAMPMKSYNFYIFNPSTREFLILPAVVDRDGADVRGVCLTFEPSISSEYKVILLRESVKSNGLYWIENYSSVTRSWRQCGSPSVVPNRYSVGLVCGVFCNGVVHWFSTHPWSCLCFDVENENLKIFSHLSTSREMKELYKQELSS